MGPACFLHCHYVFMYNLLDAVPFSNVHFGNGAGLIHLDDVDCTGSESKLLDCRHRSSVHCTYGYNEDAGVRCQGKFINRFDNVLCL